MRKVFHVNYKRIRIWMRQPKKVLQLNFLIVNFHSKVSFSLSANEASEAADRGIVSVLTSLNLHAHFLFIHYNDETLPPFNHPSSGRGFHLGLLIVLFFCCLEAKNPVSRLFHVLFALLPFSFSLMLESHFRHHQHNNKMFYEFDSVSFPFPSKAAAQAKELFLFRLTRH